MWQFKKDTVVRWFYYDGDEFNGSSIDKEKWQTSYSWTEVNYSFDFFMNPKRILFENGVCKFTCDRDTGLYAVPEWQLDSAFKKKYKSSLTDQNKFKYYYSSGIVRSRKPYGKGYFELRFKNDDSYGMWPAFWLYGKNKDEIDFFELKGERNSDVHVDVHCDEGCDHGYKGNNLFPRSFGGWIKTTQNLKKGYNIISGEWQDGYVKWYLNGLGIAYYKGEFNTEKMNLILGTGPAKDGEPFSPGVNKESYFPNSFDVDYVRIWTRKEATKEDVVGQRDTYFDYSQPENLDKSRLKRKIRFMYNKRQLEEDLLTVSIMPSARKKIGITSLGKNINYKIVFYDLRDSELLSINITSEYSEIDFSKITDESTLKIRIEVGAKTIEDQLLVD